MVLGHGRFLSRDGRWRVDLIRLTATSDQRDGERLRVHRGGFEPTATGA